MKIEAERGFLIIAQNNSHTDYVRCARTLARSIHHAMPGSLVCLVTDQPHEDAADFDFVKLFPMGDQAQAHEWKLINDWQCFYASPFRQTIKIEADMVVPQDINHWFDVCQHRDVAVTVGARDYRQHLSRCRYYRKVFDDNDLPDVYNAITYWRFSRDAEKFFATVRDIMINWPAVMSHLKFAQDQPINTDLAYAVAMQYLGPEKFYLPLSVPSLVHMKPRFNNLQGDRWTDELVWEITDRGIRVNTVQQMWPIHYHEKDFCQELEKFYG